MAQELDLQIVVYDDREEFATPDRFPENVQVIRGPRRSDRTPQPNQPGLHRHHDLSIRQGCPGPERRTPDASKIHWHDRQRSFKCLRVMGDLSKAGVSQEKLTGYMRLSACPSVHIPRRKAISVLAQIVQIMNQDRLEKKAPAEDVP